MVLLLFILIFGVYGITNIIVYSHIFESIRKFMSKISNSIGKLFKCMMCMSFWVGILLCIGVGSLIGLTFMWINIPILIFLGGFFSGTTWLIHTIQEYFEK